MSYWAAAGSIVLTGGEDSDYEATAQTSLLAVQTCQWEQGSNPNLNVARHAHTSMSLGKQCYVACGRGDGGYLASVEMLRLGVQAWELINIPDFTPRKCPVLSKLDTQSIAILGGLDGGYPRSDGVVFNAETAAVVRQINPVS